MVGVWNNHYRDLLSGDDALSLTIEHGGIKDDQQTKVLQETNNKKLICQKNGSQSSQFLLNINSDFVYFF